MKYNEEYWNKRPNKKTPVYIMNVIAVEFGIGDGKGNFTV